MSPHHPPCLCNRKVTDLWDDLHYMHSYNWSLVSILSPSALSMKFVFMTVIWQFIFIFILPFWICFISKHCCILWFDISLLNFDRTMASQVTSLTIVYSSVNSGTGQRKHQSSASLAFVRGIHRWLLNSPHKGPVTRNMFPFDGVIMEGRLLVLVLSIPSYLIGDINLIQQWYK